MVIAESAEKGKLGVPHLKRIWSSAIAARHGQKMGRKDEDNLDKTLLNALGIGLHQTMQYLFLEAPSFAEFENWIIATSGLPDPLSIKRLNRLFGTQTDDSEILSWFEQIDNSPEVLTERDIAQWHDEGYVVLKEAIPSEDLHSTVNIICDFIGVSQDDPTTWYKDNCTGIMVELIQHPQLSVNRHSQRIHKAFAQLWRTADLWVSADRCGFHPPQQDGFPFPGPDLHWDIDFSRPLTSGTQGILYLTDTPAEQGALTLVPGFHHKLQQWHSSLPTDCDPQQQDLHALGSMPVAGKAGDLVIWNQLLPHGSSPNLEKQPRFVQYINMWPCSTIN